MPGDGRVSGLIRNAMLDSSPLLAMRNGTRCRGSLLTDVIVPGCFAQVYGNKD
jgi:hypothetical protein